MPRKKYNPEGINEYSTPKDKPARFDLRRKHKILDDPLEKNDKLKEEKVSNMKSTKDKDFNLAKKLAFKKIKTAGEIKHIKDTTGYEAARNNLDGFNFKETGLKSIATTYKHLASAFYHMAKATNTFSKCKSSQISPDGKLGGKGYIQPIKVIRGAMAESMNVMSELLDTFYDEVNGPYWKKQTFEDNPLVKDILTEADEIVDKAEMEEEKTTPILEKPKDFVPVEEKIIEDEEPLEEPKLELDDDEETRKSSTSINKRELETMLSVLENFVDDDRLTLREIPSNLRRRIKPLLESLREDRRGV